MSDIRWGALLFGAGLLVRLTAVMGNLVFGTDSCHYLLMADWMREGRMHEALSIAYHPMYPLLTAAARSFFPTTEQAGNAVSVLLGAAAVVPLFSVVKAVFGRPAAVLTALFYAFHPLVVETQSDPMTEGAFMFFFFSSMALTWRLMEAPSIEGGVALGLAAGAACLTRGEGLLALVFALAWPIVEAIRRRDVPLRRIGAIAATVIVALCLMSPYLLWVKSVRGHWAMSVRPSGLSAERSMGLSEGADIQEPGQRRRLYAIYGISVFKLTLYGVLIPFYLVGLARLRRAAELRKILFYLSFPLCYLAALLWTLRTHNFMTDRYLFCPMSLLTAVGALGMVQVLRMRWAQERPAIACAAVFLIAAVPGVKCLAVRRADLQSFPGAGRWLREEAKRPVVVSGLEQVSYYCGSRSYYLPLTPEAMEPWLKVVPLDYLAYSEKDVQRRPDYVARLRSWDRLEPAREYSGSTGTWKVYFHRVKYP